MEKEKRQIFIGGAWPYANNSLHVGHLAALLPGDIIARYFRKSGDNVLYVSGSDCHGTPITLRANKLGTSPEVIANHYDAEFRQNFLDLDFSYDLYSATTSEYHKKRVQDFLLEVKKNGYLFEREELEDFCECCNKFVSDREIVGICPICGAVCDGDQCDKCLTSLTPSQLKDKKCKICNSSTTEKTNKHLYFSLSAFNEIIEKYVQENENLWRNTAVNETKKYLKEGLKDRALTRQLNWGVKLPFEGFDDKRVYVWFEAVLGYLTAGEQVAKQQNFDFDLVLKNPKTTCYYVHGKDNIVFHTIILPALLQAIDEKYEKPKMIVSCEYVNIAGDKMSKSKGNLITVNSLLENFASDSIRYFFSYNNPERRDTSFSIDDFIEIHNKHLVGGYGNFVNRNLSFLFKKYNGIVPKLCLFDEVKQKVDECYEKCKEFYEKGDVKEASQEIYSLIQFSNKFYDESKPWTLYENEKEEFDKVTSNCLYLICNIANISQPIMPKAARKVKEFLGVGENDFSAVSYDENIVLKDISILFERINAKDVDLTKGAGDTLKI